MAAYDSYWNSLKTGAANKFGPGSGSSGYFTGADTLTSSPFDSNYWGSVAGKYGNTQQNQGNIARIGPDGLAYTGGSTTRYSGKDPVTGKMYKDGVEQTLIPGSSDQYINPNDPNQRYQAVSISKDPTLSGAADDLSAQFAKSAKASLTDYSKILDDYKKQAGVATDASRAAADTGPTQAALQTAQDRFSTGLDTSQAEYRARNAENTGVQRDIINQEQADLGRYDTLNDQANALAQAGVTKQVSRYGLGKNASAGGANLGLGSDETALLARESYAASFPYQMAKEARAQQVLQNRSNTENQLSAADAARIGFDVSTNAQRYQSAQGTAQAIQALKVSAASLDWDTVSRIMSVPQLAAQVQQQILAGDTQLAQALSGLKSTTNYQGLQDRLGANITQPQYYSQANPGYPAASTPSTFGPNYPTTVNGGGGGQAGPTQTSTGEIPGFARNPGENLTAYWNRYWSEKQRTYPTGYPGDTTAGLGPDAQAGYKYNPATGKLDDARGNWWDPTYGSPNITDPNMG